MITINNTPIAIGQPTEIQTALPNLHQDTTRDGLISDTDTSTTRTMHTPKSHFSDDTGNVKDLVDAEELDDRNDVERAEAYKEQVKQRREEAEIQYQRDLEEADAEITTARENQQAQAASDEQVCGIVNVSLTDRTAENRFAMLVQRTQSGKTKQSTAGIVQSQALDKTAG